MAVNDVEVAARALLESEYFLTPIDPVDWLQAHFYIPETEEPIRLTLQQRIVIREMMRKENGLFVYGTMLYSSMKKSGKTAIAAGICLWHAFQSSFGHLYVVANDLKQADSRLMEAIRICVQLNARMKKAVKVTPSGYKIALPNQAVIEAIPADPAGEAGMNPTAVFWTEAWGAKYDRHVKLWTETTLSPTQQGTSFRFVESYAGFTGESPVLEPLYEATVTQGERIHAKIEMYANRAGRLFAYWNTQYHLPWQTKEYYVEEETLHTPSEYRRVHHNEWAAPTAVFVPYVWWEACQGQMGKLEREPMVLGVDAGVSNDCFAIVGVTRKADHITVRYVKVWVPPKGKDIDFNEPEAEIVRLCKQYNVVQVAYDPYQLEHTMQRLKRQNIGWMKKFDQSSRRLLADKKLHDMVRDRQLTHGDDPTLNDHIRNANMKTSGDIDKLRIVKRNDTLKIDAAVALSMAAYEAMRLNLA